MRKLLGGVILAVGVGAIGYWGAKDHALGMQTAIAAGAKSATSGAVHGVETVVTGRDILITGLADSEGERDAIVAALNQIEGRRVVTDALDILPSADPYTIAATRKGGQTLLQGNVPSEEMRAVLAQNGAAGVESLTLASGAPERWEAAIGTGLGALSQMDEGSVSLNAQTLRLTGLVDQPKDRDALIAGVILPAGYTLENDIETRDDGTPVGYSVNYDAATGVTLTGKLPSGLDIAQIGDSIGTKIKDGDVKVGISGDPSMGLTALRTLKSWLPEFEAIQLSVSDEISTLKGTVSPGVNPRLVQARMIEEFGDAVELSISPLARAPQSGSERVNAATGLAEQFQSGVWLPKFGFSPSLRNCAAQSDELLASAKINFLSGSTELRPRSQRAINGLASILDRCTREARLVVELGGHTDSTGSGNYELSAARALAVGEAMIARGVPRAAISAVGYGPSKPIADNATEEGRTANRRTTVRWAQQ